MVLDISGNYSPNPAALGNILQAQENNSQNQSAGVNSNAQTQQTNFSSQSTELSLSSFSGDRASFLSEAEIINGINASLGDSGLRIETASADDFTPEAVAERIVGQVQDLIANFAGTEEEAEEILSQAREGIEAGIEQARDILEGLNALNQQTNQGIEDTESFIEEGLASLEESLSSLFDDDAITEELARPQPDGEEEVTTTQFTQTAQASQLAAEFGQAEDRARPTF